MSTTERAQAIYTDLRAYYAGELKTNMAQIAKKYEVSRQAVSALRDKAIRRGEIPLQPVPFKD